MLGASMSYFKSWLEARDPGDGAPRVVFELVSLGLVPILEASELEEPTSVWQRCFSLNVAALRE
jgi:hypothetical protein